MLPDHVRGPLGTESGSGSGWGQGGFGYEGVPNGWWCERCGRVNYQALMRMRWCESERCRVSVVSLILLVGLGLIGLFSL